MHFAQTSSNVHLGVQDKILRDYKAYSHITGMSRKSNSQKNKKWHYITIITYVYHHSPQFSEMPSTLERIEYTKTNLCTSVQWAFRKQFHIDLPLQA
jgi:hypothetical protein